MASRVAPQALQVSLALALVLAGPWACGRDSSTQTVEKFMGAYLAADVASLMELLSEAIRRQTGLAGPNILLEWVAAKASLTPRIRRFDSYEIVGSEASGNTERVDVRLRYPIKEALVATSSDFLSELYSRTGGWDPQIDLDAQAAFAQVRFTLISEEGRWRIAEIDTMKLQAPIVEVREGAVMQIASIHTCDEWSRCWSVWSPEGLALQHKFWSNMDLQIVVLGSDMASPNVPRVTPDESNAGSAVDVSWRLLSPSGRQLRVEHKANVNHHEGKTYVADRLAWSEVSKGEGDGLWGADLALQGTRVAVFLFELEFVDALPEALVRSMVETSIRQSEPSVTIHGGSIRPDGDYGFTPDPLWDEYLAVLGEFGVTWESAARVQQTRYLRLESWALEGVEHPQTWREYERRRGTADERGRWQVTYAAAKSLDLEIKNVNVTRTQAQVEYRYRWSGCPSACELSRRIESLRRKYPGRVLASVIGGWSYAQEDQWSESRFLALEWTRETGWRATRF